VLEEVFHGTDNELLDFHDKYESSAKGAKSPAKSSAGMASTSRKVNPDLPEGVADEIRRLALETFRVLGSSGVCRIDFMMNGDTNEVFVNEINTIPGSLAYYLWTASGLTFRELMDRLVELALDRERRRSRMTFSYDTNLLSTYNEPAGSKGAKA
ncbi:MAG: D-alanine--D-alanine ligase, partial [Solobacterium sp.]|nr:D-alanine--D-alanine ligase [Solobacterium sp.]